MFEQRCCVTAKMDVDRTRAQCPILPFGCLSSVCAFKYHLRVVAYKLLIWLSYCEVSNDVDSFLTPVKQRDLSELKRWFLLLCQAPDKLQGL